MKINFSAELTVDGLPHNPGLVHPFYQSDPFPGNHRYALTIKGNGVSKTLLSLTALEVPGAYRNLAWRDCKLIFWNIQRFLVSEGTEAVSSYDYLLNSVAVLSVSADEAQIEGICSAILTSS